MLQVTAYRLADGSLHASYSDAKREADKRVADQLTKIGHRLAKCDGKFSRLCHEVMNMLPELRRLMELNHDAESLVEVEE